MQLHLVQPADIHGKSVFLQGQEAKHVVSVLRKSVGDDVVFTDGTGRFLHATIDRCSPKELHAEIVRIEDDPREAGAPWSSLGIALLKGDHFELAVEKAVELGVHRIIPVVADRCVVKLKGNDGRKRERWQRVADSAVKQSNRSWRTLVEAPHSLQDCVQDFGEGRVFVADEEETGIALSASAPAPGQKHLGLVGPEGAFSPEEKQWLRDAGAIAVSLGPFRLRSETAAIVMAAHLNGGRSHG